MILRTIFGVIFLLCIVLILVATNSGPLTGSELLHSELANQSLGFSPYLPQQTLVRLISSVAPGSQVQIILYSLLIFIGVLGTYVLLKNSLPGGLVYLLSPLALVMHFLPSSQLIWLYAFGPWLVWSGIKFGQKHSFTNALMLVTVGGLSLPINNPVLLLLLITISVSIGIRSKLKSVVAFLACLIFAGYLWFTDVPTVSRFSLVKEAGEGINPLVDHLDYWQGLLVLVFFLGITIAVGMLLNYKYWLLGSGVALLTVVLYLLGKSDILLILALVISAFAIASLCRLAFMRLRILVPQNDLALNLIIVGILLLPLLIIALPAFSGNLFYAGLRVEIPAEYYEAASFIEKQPKIGYLATGVWEYTNWGYQGIGLWKYNDKVKRFTNINEYLANGGLLVVDETSLEPQTLPQDLLLVEQFGKIKIVKPQSQP